MTAPDTPDTPERAADVDAWLKEQRGSFTDEALRDQLLVAGHSPADVDAAFARVRAADLPVPGAEVPPADGSAASPLARDWPPPAATEAERSQAAGTILGFLGTAAIVVGLPVVLLNVGLGNSAAVVGLVALVGCIVVAVIARDSGHRGVATGIATALILIVVLPVVAVVGLFGYCLVAGGRVV